MKKFGKSAVDVQTERFMRGHLIAGQMKLLRRILDEVINHSGVHEAVHLATAAGISMPAIIAVILPLVLQYMLTGTIDWKAVIAAIMKLIQK